MTFCTTCGKEVPPGMRFCTACGTPVATAESPPAAEQPAIAPNPALADQAPPRGSRYAVMSTGSYFGTILLFALPVIGWILCIIFACGGTKNLNKRNLARANLIFFLIALILSVILFFVFRALGGWFMDSLQQYYYYDMSGGLGW